MTVTDAGPRRTPTQQRSRDRVARILAVATTRIATSGSDALRMSDVATDAGISIGSLYQYFPDKSAILGMLAENYNAEGRACVARILSDVRKPQNLEPALIATLDGYYTMFLENPVMRDIWSATQADKSLRALDAQDCRAHGDMLAELLLRLAPTSSPSRRVEIASAAYLMMQLIAATVRLAIALPRADGDAAVATFKRLKPWHNLLKS